MSLYDFIGKAHKAKSPKALKYLLVKAEGHLTQARLINWPALEQSWQQDVEVIRSILDKRTTDEQE